MRVCLSKCGVARRGHRKTDGSSDGRDRRVILELHEEKRVRDDDAHHLKLKHEMKEP